WKASLSQEPPRFRQSQIRFGVSAKSARHDPVHVVRTGEGRANRTNVLEPDGLQAPKFACSIRGVRVRTELHDEPVSRVNHHRLVDGRGGECDYKSESDH